jgi:deoxyribodipyrimidine photo-lyase
MAKSVVWFKKDLRIHDNAALAKAAEAGAVCCIYIVEPSIWQGPDASKQHYDFILESLRDLYVALKKLGATLHVLTGEACDVLERLHAQTPFDAIYSHQETGNYASFMRDLAVKGWCKNKNIAWHEPIQSGVFRGRLDRDDWQRLWTQHTTQSQTPTPERLVSFEPVIAQIKPPTAEQLAIDLLDPPNRQRGGRSQAMYVLDDFINNRSEGYRGGISSPLSAPTACSRISPYLTHGCVSVREVYQRVMYAIADETQEDSRRAKGLRSMVSRLYWHCHFIQKLESEPELEFQNMHRGYDGLRENDWNAEYFNALSEGRTGWPMVDACVAMLKHTGWINFRMRALLVSTAAYPLWLHWKPVGNWLARHFLDYEPGIHWSQMQMQSGTTGINIPRVYNPIKQAQDHDPRGVFVRKWLPELRQVPDPWIFEPWKIPDDLIRTVSKVSPSKINSPIVDLEMSTRTAKQKLFERRARPEVSAEKSAVLNKHGSRKRPVLRNKPKPSTAPPVSLQHTLDF